MTLLLYLKLLMNQRAFTLIELIMVIVLIGIMAAIVVPRLGNVQRSKAVSFIDKVQADIRYAQNLAMTRGKRTRINFTASSYSVTQDTSAAGDCSSFAAASDPATGGTMTIDLSKPNYAGLTVTPVSCLEYDSLGRPYVCGGGACSVAQSGMSFTINANAVAVGTVTITVQTGAVN